MQKNNNCHGSGRRETAMDCERRITGVQSKAALRHWYQADEYDSV